MRVLLDTNVLLDFYLRRPGFFEDAAALFVAAWLGLTETWASAKSFTDVFYVGAKAVGPDAIQSAMESSLATLRVCSISDEDIRLCLSRRWKDFEDCVVARAAERVRADLIVTRDAKGFELAPIEVCSPAQALVRIGQPGFDLHSVFE